MSFEAGTSVGGRYRLVSRLLLGVIIGTGLAALLTRMILGFSGVSRMAFLADAAFFAVAAIAWRGIFLLWKHGAPAALPLSDDSPLVNPARESMSLSATFLSMVHYRELFTDLLERSYISKIETYGGEKIAYLGDTIEGEQARVQTKLVTKGSGEIPIEYRMHKKNDHWMVYDVAIEGVSLVANYRTQFNKIIQTSSFQELMNKMKNKQQELMTGQS